MNFERHYMVIQCKVCRRIKVNGRYRYPWPGELPLETNKTYCPKCAEDTLKSLQKGKLPFHYQRAHTTAAS
jgi:Zn finger protein HypA/HybF involved in hydrogenase expression